MNRENERINDTKGRSLKEKEEQKLLERGNQSEQKFSDQLSEMKNKR